MFYIKFGEDRNTKSLYWFTSSLVEKKSHQNLINEYLFLSNYSKQHNIIAKTLEELQL